MFNLVIISNILMMKEHVYNHVIINIFMFRSFNLQFVLIHVKILNIYMNMTINVAKKDVQEYIK